MDEVFNPYMLQLARAAREMTQQELSDKAEISQGKLSKVEHGILAPTPEDVSSFSSALEFPREFFYEKMVPRSFPPYHHRKRKSLSARTLDAIHAAMNIKRMHVAKLIKSVEMRVAKAMPRYDADEINGDAANVARIVREHAGLPRGPISNMVDVLESAGVIVVECNFGTTKLDALSTFDEGIPPLVFVSTEIPGDRLRFTLAHELGHLVLHSIRPMIDDEEMERQADEFAAELLMPEKDIKPYLSHLSLAKLAPLKEIWKVSMQALLRRAKTLKAISPAEYERFCKIMSREGYRLREPIEIPREKARSLRSLIDAHLGELGYTVGELSSILRLRAQEFGKSYLGGDGKLRLVASNEIE